mgnify:CR=1 FL=1
MRRADTHRRVRRLEGAAVGQLALPETIDRPPVENREQWLTRIAGHPDLSVTNSRGENYAQWIARRHQELEMNLRNEC